MKRLLPMIAFICVFIFSSIPVYAASSYSIIIDGVAINSDVTPEIRNGKMMVPVRVVSEYLGAKVMWTQSEVTLTKDKTTIKLQTNSIEAEKNGMKLRLDAAPYIQKNRFMVPIRFIAETFNATVNYNNSTAAITTAPLIINGVKIKAIQQLGYMFIGGYIDQMEGHVNHKELYALIVEHQGDKTEKPAQYSIHSSLDYPESYYHSGTYTFIDKNDKIVRQVELYGLLRMPPGEQLEGLPEALLYDKTEDQWYEFSRTAIDQIYKLFDTAREKGFAWGVDSF